MLHVNKGDVGLVVWVAPHEGPETVAQILEISVIKDSPDFCAKVLGLNGKVAEVLPHEMWEWTRPIAKNWFENAVPESQQDFVVDADLPTPSQHETGRALQSK